MVTVTKNWLNTLSGKVWASQYKTGGLGTSASHYTIDWTNLFGDLVPAPRVATIVFSDGAHYDLTTTEVANNPSTKIVGRGNIRLKGEGAGAYIHSTDYGWGFYFKGTNGGPHFTDIGVTKLHGVGANLNGDGGNPTHFQDFLTFEDCDDFWAYENITEQYGNSTNNLTAWDEEGSGILVRGAANRFELKWNQCYTSKVNGLCVDATRLTGPDNIVQNFDVSHNKGISNWLWGVHAIASDGVLRHGKINNNITCGNVHGLGTETSSVNSKFLMYDLEFGDNISTLNARLGQGGTGFLGLGGQNIRVHDNDLSHNLGDGGSDLGSGMTVQIDSTATKYLPSAWSIYDNDMTYNQGSGLVVYVNGQATYLDDFKIHYNNFDKNTHYGFAVFNTIANCMPHLRFYGNKMLGNIVAENNSPNLAHFLDLISIPYGFASDSHPIADVFLGDTALNSTNFTATVGARPEDLYINPVTDTGIAITRAGQAITPPVFSNGVWTPLGRFTPNASIVITKTGTAAILRRFVGNQ